MSSTSSLSILQDLCPDAAANTIPQALSASNDDIEQAAQQLFYQVKLSGSLLTDKTV